MDKLPELYKEYDCYDDGKMSESRRYKVKIVNIIPFKDADPELVRTWHNTVIDHDWLYAEETDYFIYAVSYEWWFPQVEIFARTKNGGWFGLGQWDQYEQYWNSTWCSGRLVIPE